MKTISFHSMAGGTSHSLASINCAVEAACQKLKVCLIDLDFIGLGLFASLFVFDDQSEVDFTKRDQEDFSKKKFIEFFFLSDGPNKVKAERLITTYRGLGLDVIRNMHDFYLGKSKRSKALQMHEDMQSIFSTECLYREMQARLAILVEKLEKLNYDLVVFHCHIGRQFVSHTIQPLVDESIWVD